MTVIVREVSMRDGLQDLSRVLKTADKLTMLQLLVDAGLTRLEVTSMVPPRLLPQFADAEQVLAAGAALPALHRAAFTPNAKGVERAVAAGADEVALAVGTTDALNEANFATDTEGVLRRIAEAVAVGRDAGCEVSVTVGGAFGCPFNGPVHPDTVRRIVQRLTDLDANTLLLGDTTGMADLASIAPVVLAALDEFGPRPVGVHLHGGLGAVPRVVTAADAGATVVDTSMNGLGGSPFVPSAPGNTPTVAVVAALEDAGHATGMDRDRLREADQALARLLAGVGLGREATSG